MSEDSQRKKQTEKSFQDKWKNNPNIAVDLTMDPDSNFQKWILQRNGFSDREAFKEFLNNFNTVLDAGCGNGRVTNLMSSLAKDSKIIGVDIVDLKAARANNAKNSNVEFLNADLCSDLSKLGTFDLIYCQEVLHHTEDPELAFRNLAQRLNHNGMLCIYVYKVKAQAREYMDDLIRKEISELDYENAMELCGKITELGRNLSIFTDRIEVPDIPELGINGGSYTPQRFVYHFFMKCYWNKALTESENAAINYDWYHPQNCSRHTLDEVRGWFEKMSIKICWECVDHYGITLHGCKY